MAHEAAYSPQPESRNPNREADAIRGRKVMLVGPGRVGAALFEQLQQAGVHIPVIVRSSGVYADFSRKIAEHSEWTDFISKTDAVCITMPTEKKGQRALPYVGAFLVAGKPVVTAEKAALASNPLLLKNQFVHATATVGGGTAMLRHIERYPGPIKEIKAVVNGTFNFLSTGDGDLQQRIAAANAAGYMETDTDDFDVICEDEQRDVVRKAVILANRSGMCKDVVQEEDISFVPPRKKDLRGRRCIVRITGFNTSASVEAGFIEQGDSEWLPHGVNNTLYINGERKAEGPGAGPSATARVMLEDLGAAFSNIDRSGI